MGFSKCLVVPPAVDILELFRLTEPTKNYLHSAKVLKADCILYMPVRLSYRKNIPFAIRILKCIMDSVKNSILIITGTPSNDKEHSDYVLEEVRRCVTEHKIERNVIILSGEVSRNKKVSRDDVIGLYSLADLVLCTSHQEGFFIPTLEAKSLNTSIFAPALDTLISWSTGFVNF
jgi:glycosyltransferase involved in cell wall biosynthesis